MHPTFSINTRGPCTYQFLFPDTAHVPTVSSFAGCATLSLVRWYVTRCVGEGAYPSKRR